MIDFYKQTDNWRGSWATGKTCMYFQFTIVRVFLLVICHCLALCHSFVLEDVVRLVEMAMVTQQWSRAGRVGWYQQKRSLMISMGFPNSWSYNCAMDFKHAASPQWFKSVDTHWAGKVQSFVPLLQNEQGVVVFTKLGQFCSTILSPSYPTLLGQIQLFWPSDWIAKMILNWYAWVWKYIHDMD